MKNLIATALGSLLLGAGATATLTTDSVQVVDLKAEKHQILKDNVWKDVRLGETPVWDVSVVSAEEMTSAYIELANEMNAKQKDNLFEGLRDEVIKEGIKCL